MARRSLGDIEQLVLLSILQLGNETYGVPVVDEIEARTGRAVPRAAVYIALRRLRQKGLVSSWMSESDPVPGGKAKRYFRVEPDGIEKLAEQRSSLLNMWDGLQPLLDR